MNDKVIIMSREQLVDFAKEIAKEILESAKATAPERKETTYVYGLHGISKLFGISHTTAQAWKNGFLQPAIDQRGRHIRVDVEMAHKLYAEYKNQAS